MFIRLSALFAGKQTQEGLSGKKANPLVFPELWECSSLETMEAALATRAQANTRSFTESSTITRGRGLSVTEDRYSRKP